MRYTCERPGGADVNGDVRGGGQEFMPLMVAGWKLWPAVGLLAFTLVPVERRVLFGGLVALGWNIYLGLVMAAA